MVSLTALTTAAKAGKTPRKQKPRPLHTFPATFMTEIKRTIATESVSLFSATDMSINDQNLNAGWYYHGTAAIVSQIRKFLLGLDKYGNIWVKEDTPDGPTTVMPESLHRQMDKVLIAGRTITQTILERTFVNREGRVSGRTIRGWALICIRESKKMLTLIDEAVKEKILVREGDEYGYFSGKNESDFINFLCYRMYHWSFFNGASGDEDINVNGEETSDKKDTTLEADSADEVAEEVVNPIDLDGRDEDADESSVSDELPNPPPNYLPIGFIYFMTRGPLADKEYRVNILALHAFLEDGLGGRSSHRKENAKKKSAAKDFDLGQDNTARQQRGLALGADNRKK